MTRALVLTETATSSWRSARLVVLRPPSGLMLIPIVNTLARVFRDQQASKFKPTEAELLSSLAAWPETGNVRGKICEKPCGIEWTVTPSACSWGAIYSESAAAIIPTVRRRDDEWRVYAGADPPRRVARRSRAQQAVRHSLLEG